MVRTYGKAEYYEQRMLALKRLLEGEVADWQLRNPGAQRKWLADELGISPGVLSHWLSPHKRDCIPPWLVGEFCMLVGSWTLLRWMDRRRSA